MNSTTVDGPAGEMASIKIGETVIPSYDAAKISGDELAATKKTFDTAVNDALKAAGYPMVAAENTSVAKAEHFLDIFTAQKLKIIVVLTYLILLVTMVYGPIAAMLVELYPTRIRYSGLPLPYHRQRLVRWPSARDRLRDLGAVGQHLCGPVVRHRGRGDDCGDRGALCPRRHPQEGHLCRQRQLILLTDRLAAILTGRHQPPRFVFAAPAPIGQRRPVRPCRPPAPGPPQVLIVEDEDNIAMALDYVLRREGYGADRLATGAGALDHIRATRPDLVLLDVMLPEVSGYEICAEARRDAGLSDLKIVMMTARARPPNGRGMELGADGFVAKPFELDELRAEVRRLLSGPKDALGQKDTGARR